ncbi:MAG TPA: pyruvate kinase [Gammaproteobacteria bacterium]|nr:pyruvate kinase [Gammaproteobacteria bacterium]
MRRTKIVATLGPATDRDEVLEQVLAAGVDVVRLNFSHGEADEQRRRVAAVRAAAAKLGRDVGVLMDLQGPKIRIECFRDGPVELEEGASFTLDVSLGTQEGDRERVGVTYKKLPQDVHAGDTLVLADGQIALTVDEVDGPRICCRVKSGGTLSDHKGVNRLGGGLSAETLTDKDREDIKIAAECDCDYLAVSFPRSASDVERARRLLRAAGGEASIVAKIERAEAVENLDAIILASDAVMIARGDLAVEIGDAPLPGVQKRIVRRARKYDTAVITATQMMESMVTSPVPTRAEILDVANAVLDGSDAVMLSEETAVGKYPVKVVEAMARVCIGAESDLELGAASPEEELHFAQVDQTIAMAAIYVAKHLAVRALVTLTETGATALYMSRVNSEIPVYAFTRHERTRRRVTLYRNVYPVPFAEDPESAKVVHDVAATLVARDAVGAEDAILLTRGVQSGVSGGTNSLHVVRVADVLGGKRS